MSILEYLGLVLICYFVVVIVGWCIARVTK